MRSVSLGVPVEEDGDEDDGNFSNTDDDQEGVGHRRSRYVVQFTVLSLAVVATSM
jgi:hypothetical protein